MCQCGEVTILFLAEWACLTWGGNLPTPDSTLWPRFCQIGIVFAHSVWPLVGRVGRPLVITYCLSFEIYLWWKINRVGLGTRTYRY